MILKPLTFLFCLVSVEEKLASEISSGSAVSSAVVKWPRQGVRSCRTDWLRRPTFAEVFIGKKVPRIYGEEARIICVLCMHLKNVIQPNPALSIVWTAAKLWVAVIACAAVLVLCACIMRFAGS